jgi:hypothetical protein
MNGEPIRLIDSYNFTPWRMLPLHMEIFCRFDLVPKAVTYIVVDNNLLKWPKNLKLSFLNNSITYFTSLVIL